MGTRRRTWAPLLALAGVCILLGASSASAATLVMGTGVGPWRIGAERVVRAGLELTEAYPENARGGCVAGLPTATRIDYYPGYVVGSIGGIVFDVATTRGGDRSTSGFEVGRSRFRAVRARHPRAPVSRARGDVDLADVSLTVHRRTGYEAHMSLTYWFQRDGLLVALETGVGGC